MSHTTKIMLIVTFIVTVGGAIAMDKERPAQREPEACSVCMEPLSDPAAIEVHGPFVRTRCGHWFHRNCIMEWLARAGTCSSCRTGLTEADVITPAAIDIFDAVGRNDVRLVENLIDIAHVDINVRNVDGFTPLILAAQRGNFDLIKLLLARRANLFIRADDQTARGVAAVRGYREIVEFLEIKEHEVEAQLIAAAGAGDMAIVTRLIESGVDVNTRNEHGITPFINAVAHPDIVAYLIEHHAQVNERNNQGESALTRAIRAGAVEMVRVLCGAGAIMDNDNIIDREAFEYAKANDLQEIIACIARFFPKPLPTPVVVPTAPADSSSHGDTDEVSQLGIEGLNDMLCAIKFAIEEDHLSINERHEGGETWLITAVSEGNFEAVHYLIEHEANLNILSRYGQTALMIAIEQRFTPLVETLINAGADITIRDGNGYTALGYAARSGVARIIDLLHSRERLSEPALVKETVAVPCASSSGGVVREARTLLYELFKAIEENNKERVLMLIGHGVDVNGTLSDRDGELLGALQHAQTRATTALMLAIQQGFIDIAQILIDHNADVMVEDGDHRNASYYAQRDGYRELVQRIHDRVRHISALIGAAAIGLAEVVREELSRPGWGGYINAQMDGMTALMQAAQAGHVEVTRILLNHDARIDLRNQRGETALDLAMKSHQAAIVELLEEKNRRDIEASRIRERMLSASSSSSAGVGAGTIGLRDGGAAVTAGERFRDNLRLAIRRNDHAAIHGLIGEEIDEIERTAGASNKSAWSNILFLITSATHDSSGALISADATTKEILQQQLAGIIFTIQHK